MAAAKHDRRVIISILLDSGLYCGTIYAMPLRERLALVKKLEDRQKDRYDGQEADGLLVQVKPERIFQD